MQTKLMVCRRLDRLRALVGCFCLSGCRHRPHCDRGACTAHARVAADCAKCGNFRAYYQQLQVRARGPSGFRRSRLSRNPRARGRRALCVVRGQIRSADEPMTVFYKCTACGFRWRED